MKMKATAFSVVTLPVCFLAGAANAAPTFSGKFTFPYEVHWGRTVLPAGNYSITIDRLEPAAIVRSTNGKTHFVVMNPSRATASTAARFFSSLSKGPNAAFRRDVAELVGIGFELPRPQIVPSSAEEAEAITA